jgi:hypothetical protein
MPGEPSVDISNPAIRGQVKAGQRRGHSSHICYSAPPQVHWAPTCTPRIAAAASRRHRLSKRAAAGSRCIGTARVSWTRRSTTSATPRGFCTSLFFAKTPSGGQEVDLSARLRRQSRFMISTLLHLLRLSPFLCGGHRQLALENLALRQQLAVYKRTATRPNGRGEPAKGRPQNPWRTGEAGNRRGGAHGFQGAPKRRTPPSQTWRTFLTNHVRDLVAIDFFTVPTAHWRVLFVLVVLAHHRRRVVHFNVTEHPTAEWTAQQIVDAFPEDTAPSYLLRDRDKVYGHAFRQRVKGIRIREVLTAAHSPW